MAQQTGDVAVLQAYSTHELSSADALEAASLAEDALQSGSPDRCRAALGFGVECVAAESRRRDADHLHVPMRNLEESVDRAQAALDAALDAEYDGVETRVRQAITALRQTVAVVDEAATTPTVGHRYL